MPIQTKILADSITDNGNRITTFLLTYHRFIHSEFMTHRVFSRNTSSSRARPVSKLIEEAELQPAMPMFWGKNQKGMQSFEELDSEKRIYAQLYWNDARLAAIEKAKQLEKIGLHKQYVNRILEPFTHITVICTATEFGNFFNLRADKDAMPEIQELAFQMLELYETNTPQYKRAGEWHLPFADQYIEKGVPLESLLKIVTARAARVSYLNFEGDIDHEKDYKLHDDLKNSGHWSPFEHAAQALKIGVKRANFRGWKPYRKLFGNENRLKYSAEKLFNERRGEHDEHSK